MIANITKRSIKKVVTLALAAIVVLFSVISMIFVRYTFDQEFPRSEKSEFTGRLQYSDVSDQYDRTEVQFQSGENTLTGYIYGAENEKGLVVVSHGIGGGAEDYLAEILYFIDNGWRVFAFDNTGSYESEGDGTMGLSQSVIDLDAALTYAESSDLLSGLPVMLFGHSWGGYAVTAIFNYDHEIAASVSVAGYDLPMEMMEQGAYDLMGPLSYLEYPYIWIYQKILFGEKANLSAVQGINSTDTPILIIHGTADEMISFDGGSIISKKNQIINPNVQYMICDRENHNGHNSLFVSDTSAAYRDEKNEEFSALYDSYGGEIPDDVKAAWYGELDPFQVSSLDEDFMGSINSFFEDALN